MCFSAALTAQEIDTPKKVSGIILNDNSKTPIENVNVINLNKVLGTVTNAKGYFELDVSANDTLHISYIGFQSLKIRVTNDWIKSGKTNIQLTEKAIALEEVNIMPYYLTGYLEVDTKLIPTAENYRYSISGLQQGYEAGESSPNALGRVLGSIFNPADMLYNFFGRIEAIKKDEKRRHRAQPLGIQI
jgi:hypothetical protein